MPPPGAPSGPLMGKAGPYRWSLTTPLSILPLGVCGSGPMALQSDNTLCPSLVHPCTHLPLRPATGTKHFQLDVCSSAKGKCVCFVLLLCPSKKTGGLGIRIFGNMIHNVHLVKSAPFWGGQRVFLLLRKYRRASPTGNL